MEKVLNLNKQELLNNISTLIKNNQGDIGRLEFILDMLEKNKQLYKTDQKYIEKKLDTKIEVSGKQKSPKNNDIITTIKNMIDSGIGESGRLQYIINTIRKNKSLYNTDKKYLNEKIELYEKVFSQKIKTKEASCVTLTEKIESPYKETHSGQIFSEKDQIILDLEIELKKSKTKIRQLEQTINEQKIEINILKNKQSQIKIPLPNPELSELDEKINIESKKIDRQKILENKIKAQRIHLTQLIAYREKFERKVNHEKELLEQQIKFENQKISKEDEFVNRLNKKQKELEQMKVERDVILEQIKLENNRITPEIEKLRKELDELNDEYETLTKKYKISKDDLNKRIKDQKNKNENAKPDNTNNK